jgi:hypothetical protein
MTIKYEKPSLDLSDYKVWKEILHVHKTREPFKLLGYEWIVTDVWVSPLASIGTRHCRMRLLRYDRMLMDAWAPEDEVVFEFEGLDIIPPCQIPHRDDLQCLSCGHKHLWHLHWAGCIGGAYGKPCWCAGFTCSEGHQ